MKLIYYVVNPITNYCDVVVQFETPDPFGGPSMIGTKTVSLDQDTDLGGSASYTDADVAAAVAKVSGLAVGSVAVAAPPAPEPVMETAAPSQSPAA